MIITIGALFMIFNILLLTKYNFSGYIIIVRVRNISVKTY